MREREKERETLEEKEENGAMHITPDQADAAFCALYADNLLDHTRRANDDAPSCERSPFRPTIHAPFIPAWDVNVILREFTVSLARRHALHIRLYLQPDA